MSEVTAILVYDLPSENIKVIHDSSFYDEVRALRVYSITKLHSLGIQCTESVILLPSSSMSRVNDVINNIIQKYNEMKLKLQNNNIFLGFQPIIRVLPLTQQQQSTFIEIAKRRLIQRIDEAIDRATHMLEEVETIIEESKRKRIRYYTAQTIREWSTIKQFADELGIDVSREISYLIDVLERILERC